MVTHSERTKILEMIAAGTITAGEGMTLLNALDESLPLEHGSDFEVFEARQELPEPGSIIGPADSGQEPPVFLPGPGNIAPQDEAGDPRGEPASPAEEPEVIEPRPTPPDSGEIERWKRWWVVPLWIGAGITALGGLLMYWAFSANGFGFWFACAWFPFLLGVVILALAWGSRVAPWLHVRVQQAPGEVPQRIALSFPIPIRLATWGFKMFGHHIPHMEGVNLDEIILDLKDVAKDGTPFYVDVDEGENGEKVQVFIG